LGAAKAFCRGAVLRVHFGTAVQVPGKAELSENNHVMDGAFEKKVKCFSSGASDARWIAISAQAASIRRLSQPVITHFPA
jgi:hypothetical protein